MMRHHSDMPLSSIRKRFFTGSTGLLHLTLLVTLILTFSSPVILHAQKSGTLRLEGMVMDEKGEGLPYATISVHRTGKGAHTDARGRYTLTLPEGSYDLYVSTVGYKTEKKTVRGEGLRKVDFTLTPTSYGLDEVEVIGRSEAGKKELRGFEVSSLEIRSLAPSIQSLTGVMQRMSGIRIREEGGVGSDYNLVLNGLSGNAVRYYVDGVPMEAIGKGFSLSNLPLNLIERVDIYKGVVPSDLGEDALGGAVNIVTKRGGHSYLDATLSVGSFGTYRAEVTGQYALRHIGFTIRPTLSVTTSRNDYMMKGVEVWDKEAREYREVDLPRFHDRYRSALGQVEAGFSGRKWADEAFLTLSAVRSYKEIQTGQKQTIVVGKGTKQVSSLGASFRYSKRDLIIPDLSLRFFASYTMGKTLVADTAYRSYKWDGSWSPAGFTEVTGREKSLRHYDRPQLTVRSYLSYNFDNGGALDFNYLLSAIRNRRYDDLDEQFVPTTDRMDKHTFSLSYAQSFLSDRLSGSLFVKDYLFHAKLEQKDHEWITGFIDVNPESTQNNVGYGATLRYAPLKALALKGSYERSVRLPSSYEFLGNGVTILPNFRLRPEQSHNINLGLYGSTRFGGGDHRVTYEVSGFGRLVSDYIMRLVVGDRESQYTNVSSTNVLGVEGEVGYSFRDMWHVVLNGTYLDERNNTRTQQDGLPDPTFGNRLPNRPFLYANLLLGWDKKAPFGARGHRLNLSYSSSYVHWYYLSWEAYGSKSTKQTIPGQFPRNLSGTWYFPGDRVSISAECTNLFDQTIYDNYLLQKPGRAFSLKLRLFLQ